MGLDMIQGDHEDAPGQLELNFIYRRSAAHCDRLATYRQICAQVAREFDLIACFMSKPFMGVSASGCHHNLSLWRGGEDEINTLGNDPLPGMDSNFMYRKGGENTFMPRHRRRPAPGKIGLQCIGGMIEHLGGADRDRLLHCELVSPPVGHGLLGAGLRRLGLPEPHLRACAFRRPAASNTAPWMPW